MVNVLINQQAMPADITSLKTMTELVELVKTTIDPDTIITSLELSGKQLSDSDWTVPLSAQGDSTLAVTTGSKEDYVKERLGTAEHYVDHILTQFLDASEKFRSGVVEEGNTGLSRSVDDLLAFINWYSSLLSIDKGRFQGALEEFDRQISKVKDVCELIVQKQTFQSWWALGETLETDLKPLLERLKASCVENTKLVS